jgi:hypothetical protein
MLVSNEISPGLVISTTTYSQKELLASYLRFCEIRFILILDYPNF